MNRKEYIQKLFLLGCAYSTETKSVLPDIEQTVLDGLNFYWSSNDLLFMLYGLLHHRIGHLIHIERLILLAKKQNLKGDSLIVLLCLSQKLIDSGQKNFSPVIQKLGKKGLKLTSPPETETDTFLLERWGIDQEFKKYGAEVRTLPLEDKKKYFTLTKIFKTNQWLALRALIGSNNRADIFYLKTFNIVPTANQAAKILKCSNDAAYRYWRSCKEIDSIKLIING